MARKPEPETPGLRITVTLTGPEEKAIKEGELSSTNGRGVGTYIHKVVREKLEELGYELGGTR
jgi:hypothetical protein